MATHEEVLGQRLCVEATKLGIGDFAAAAAAAWQAGQLKLGAAAGGRAGHTELGR